MYNSNCEEDNYFKFGYLFPMFKHCKNYKKLNCDTLRLEKRKGTFPSGKGHSSFVQVTFP